jgi:transcriptional regulator with XRE-family HTH domain
MELHQQMRQGRERKGLSRAELAEQIGVREHVVERIEEGAFQDLPAGLYGRFAVRAYAKYLGMDPEDVLARVEGQLRVPEDPLDGLVRVHGLRPRPKRSLPPPQPAKNETPSSAVERTAASAQALDWRPAAASAIDAIFLISLFVALLRLTSTATGAPAVEVLDRAAPALALIFAVVAVSYFVLLGGLRNATFGSTLAQLSQGDGAADRVDARSILRRGLECALRESSIVVEWLLATEQGRYCLRVLRLRGV